jgi:hypothetical protein
MSRAGGQAHDTAQTFLNERERGVVDRDLRPAVFVINRHLPRIPDDPPDHIRLGEESRCNGAVRIGQLQQIHFGRAQRGRGEWLQRSPDS